MAKGSRSSTRKANNSKLKSRVFGPVETARTERLSARLLELASQPKISEKNQDEMVIETAADESESPIVVKDTGADESMDVDGIAKSAPGSKSSKGRVEKRRSSRSKASIVFPKYKNGKRVGATKSSKKRSSGS